MPLTARSRVLAALLAFLVLGSSRAQEDDPDFADDDVDLEDLDDGPAAAAPEAMEAVEDFDLAMPEKDRKKRMSACYTHVMNLLQYRRERVEATVKELLATYQDQVSQEQATNSVVFSWMMSCYMNIDDNGMKEAILGREPTQELEQSLYSQRNDRPQQVPQASKRQWNLLQEVLVEEQQKDSSQQGPKPGAGAEGAAQPAAPVQAKSGMSGQSQAVYVLVVFGAIFGLGTMAVLRLMRSEKEGRERLSKRGKEKKRKGQ